MLKAQLAVIPNEVPIFVVGGMTPDNMQPWLDAGAAGFGLGSGFTSRASRPPRPPTRARAYVAGVRRVKPIKIAIIGYGKIAARSACPVDRRQSALRVGRDLEPIGPGRRPDLHRLARTDPHGRGAGSRRHHHAARARATRSRANASLAGLHCLLEKPPTAGLAEIADLDCLAQAQQVTLFTTWHAQHHSTVDAAAKALAGKRIKSLAIHWHEDVHKWHPGQQWIWEPGGFGVFDPGINAFSIATKIFPGGLFVQRG